MDGRATPDDGTIGSMKWVQMRIVDGLERTCAATRFVEWIPGWRHVYPRCLFARWSTALDYRWGTERWPVHDEDGEAAWERWYALADPKKLQSSHTHFW